jgi:hypothetical protein
VVRCARSPCCATSVSRTSCPAHRRHARRAKSLLHHAVKRWRRADLHHVKDGTGLHQGIEMLLQFLGGHLRVVLAHEAQDVFERYEAFGDDHAGYISKIRPCPGITGSVIAAAQGCARSLRMLHLLRQTACANSEQGVSVWDAGTPNHLIGSRATISRWLGLMSLWVYDVRLRPFAAISASFPATLTRPFPSLRRERKYLAPVGRTCPHLRHQCVEQV